MKDKNVKSFGEFNESVFSDKGHAGMPGEMYHDKNKVSDSTNKIDTYFYEIERYYNEIGKTIKDEDKLKRIEMEFGKLIKFLSKEVDDFESGVLRTNNQVIR